MPNLWPDIMLYLELVYGLALLVNIVAVPLVVWLWFQLQPPGAWGSPYRSPKR